jgi:hypothetical protein
VAAPLLITEVQVGTTESGAQEFIELYNAGDKAISFDGDVVWQLQIGNATAADWQSPYRTIPLSGSVAPGAYYVIASKYTTGGASVQYMAQTAQAWFSAGISALGAHVRLVYSANQTQPDTTCIAMQTVVDEVEWSVSGQGGLPMHPSLDARPAIFITPDTTGLPASATLQRVPQASGFVDTNNDAADFILAASTSAPQKGTAIGALPTVGIQQSTCTPQPEAPPPDSLPTTPSAPGQGSEIPPADNGLLAPQVSELLPNPASPQTDAQDEFVEIYNPNDAPFELTGFTLTAGLNNAHSYAFVPGTSIGPRDFITLYSRDTKLALANTGGQVHLLDPFKTSVSQSDPYSAAPAGLAWVLADNVWQWTTTPTPQAANQLAAPPASAAKKASEAAAVKKTAIAGKAKAEPKPKATGSVKAMAAKAVKKTAAEPVKVAAAAVQPQPKDNPMHPGVLAVAGVLALLYGLYEYRHDAANKIRQLRDNRSARAAARQSLKGR